MCIAEIFFKALEVFNTSVAATEYPPIDEKFLIDIILDYLDVIYALTLVVVNLPVKLDDELAAVDFASEIFTSLPTTLIVASTKSLSEVTEFVTVACAVVPFEAQTIVTSSI
tara:strand:+ start:415 stop:750 length:336 start_codon:yes stop_codon:yes gene_type:complete